MDLHKACASILWVLEIIDFWNYAVSKWLELVVCVQLTDLLSVSVSRPCSLRCFSKDSLAWVFFVFSVSVCGRNRFRLILLTRFEWSFLDWYCWKASDCWAPQRRGPYQFCAPHPRNRGCATKVWPDNHHDYDKDEYGSYKNEKYRQQEISLLYLSVCIYERRKTTWIPIYKKGPLLTLSLLISLTSSLWNKSPASDLQNSSFKTTTNASPAS